MKSIDIEYFILFFCSFNMKNKVADIDIFIPTLKIESKYEINGKVLVLPIRGNGKFVGEFGTYIIHK